MEEGKEYGIRDFCELLNLKESCTKVILQGLSDDIDMVGVIVPDDIRKNDKLMM